MLEVGIVGRRKCRGKVGPDVGKCWGRTIGGGPKAGGRAPPGIIIDISLAFSSSRASLGLDIGSPGRVSLGSVIPGNPAGY